MRSEMSKCQSCGRPIKESEAYRRIVVGSEIFLVCCPMCMNALEAGQVQRRMITGSFSDEHATVFVEYLPAMQIGGDYTCIRYFSEDRLYMVIGDVSGHGIASSLVMIRISSEVERMVESGEDVAVIAEVLNSLMRSVLGEERLYLTLPEPTDKAATCW
jgi:hypothetical protein